MEAPSMLSRLRLQRRYVTAGCEIQRYRLCASDGCSEYLATEMGVTNRIHVGRHSTWAVRQARGYRGTLTGYASACMTSCNTSRTSCITTTAQVQLTPAKLQATPEVCLACLIVARDTYLQPSCKTLWAQSAESLDARRSLLQHGCAQVSRLDACAYHHRSCGHVPSLIEAIFKLLSLSILKKVIAGPGFVR